MMCDAVSCRRSGFTLIEIMIVIAIIAILAGIVVPNFMEARAEARLESCKGNIRYIYECLEMYSVRHPHPRNRAIVSSGSPTTDGLAYQYLAPWLAELADFDRDMCCPAQKGVVYWVYYSFVEDKEAYLSNGWTILCGNSHFMGNGHELVPFYPAMNGITVYCYDCEGACKI